MRKVCTLVLFVIASLALFACNDSTQARAAISDSNITLTGRSVTFKATLKDPNTEIKEAEINFALTGSNFSETQTVNFFTGAKEFVFEGLEPEVTYTLKVTAKQNNKSVSLLTQTFTTLAVGKAEDAPILINSVADFIAITDPKLHYRQTKDLDFAGQSIAPLFNASSRFEGSYNGGGFTIKNITMNDAEHVKTGYLSIFGYIRSGSLKNIVLENIEINNTANPDNATLYAGILASRVDDDSAVISNITIKNSSLVLRHNYRLDNGNWVNTTTRRSLFVGTVVGSVQGEVSDIIVQSTLVSVNVANLYPGLTSSAGTYIGGAIGLIEIDKGSKFENLDVDVNMVVNVNSNSNPQSSLLAIGGVVGAHRGQKGITGMISSGSIALEIEMPSGAAYSWTYVGGLIGHMVTMQTISDAVSFMNIEVKSNAVLDAASDVVTLRVGSLIGRSEQVGLRLVRVVSANQSVIVTAESMVQSAVDIINFVRPTTDYDLLVKVLELEFNGTNKATSLTVVTDGEIVDFITNAWTLTRLAYHLG